MEIIKILLILFATIWHIQAITNKTFPDDFMFGTATASYQVEGGWNADGKGENIWDRLTHEYPEKIKDGNNGDIACDSYNKWKEDVQLLKDLGVSHYRFSLSWSRIFPTGFVNEPNENGINYYKNLIGELRANNIEPLVTMYHWDLPQSLQDVGGWPNDLIIEWFADYARKCYEYFGDSVTYWMTFNEPKQTCQQGYGSGVKAPAILSPGVGEYHCAHNLLRAHARAWHIYDEEFRASQNGKVGIVIDSDWFQPSTDSDEDAEAAETMRLFTFGWYANPLFKGDYPAVMVEHVARRSEAHGFAYSLLPNFTNEESEYLKGTVDVLGVNSYSASLAAHKEDPMFDARLGWEADSEVVVSHDPSWPPSASDWLKVTPWSTAALIKWIKNTYDNPIMIITENGFSQNDTNLEDDDRISYIQNYLSNILDATIENNINLIGYTYWSLLDNFEWMNGYTEKFGLYQVDFDSGNRTRTPKKSVDYYKKVIRTKCLIDVCES